jgi:hypothetical protein
VRIPGNNRTRQQQARAAGRASKQQACFAIRTFSTGADGGAESGVPPVVVAEVGMVIYGGDVMALVVAVVVSST